MSISEVGIITTVLKERYDFIYGDAHGISYLTDPRYEGQDMDLETRDGVVDFIANCSGAGTKNATGIELLKFQAATHQPTRQIKLVQDKRIGVYEFLYDVHGYPLPHKIATTVFASTCSSAAAENYFLAHKFVHAQLRNRLKESKPREAGLHLFQHGKPPT
ncbi:hypothetical protein PI124_g6675 [Phytophthora idaei]|nr:hypothetical protein PI125_g6285 [Phytophthora idaei]KAG3162197.1 hypothetical protein PI126_g6068 [Phytophthora idaei]KAG3248651.1 hypothetical protein PI124_g6675 [Phytophthora idaei]